MPRRAGPDTTKKRDVGFEVFIAAAILLIVGALVLVANRGSDDAEKADGAPRSTEPTPVDEAPAETTTTAATTTTTTEPPRQASAEEPLRILVAGDSLVGYLPLVLGEAVAGRPVEVIDAWKGSSGLARPDFHDWPATLASLMEEHDPDVVLIGFGGNDTQSLTIADGSEPPIPRDDARWQPEYSRRVGEALDAIEADGRTLWWIGLPLSDRDNLEELRPAMTEAFEEQIAERPWAHYVDTLEVLAPDGVYRTQLPGPDGQEVRVRADDGIHLSPAGMRMILDLFLPDIEQERGLQPAT